MSTHDKALALRCEPSPLRRNRPRYAFEAFSSLTLAHAGMKPPDRFHKAVAGPTYVTMPFQPESRARLYCNKEPNLCSGLEASDVNTAQPIYRHLQCRRRMFFRTLDHG